MLKVLRRHPSSLVTTLVIASLTLSHISCATLVQLPIVLLQLPFQIITTTLRLVMGLLPYAIKFAPLALMFIENQHGDVIEYYVSLPGARQVVPVGNTVTCVVYDLRSADDPEEVMTSIAQCDGRLILSQEREADADSLAALYREMQRQNASFACEQGVLRESIQVTDVYV